MKNVFITGSNRGIGLEAARQFALKGYQVILSSRDLEKGLKSQEQLHSEGLNVDFIQLDVTSAENIKRAISKIKDKYGKLDILVNNAGILIEQNQSIFTVNKSDISRTFETNVFGPMMLIREVIPLMQANNFGRIINISSEMGSLSDMHGDYASYRMSKTLLNAVTGIFNAEVSHPNIKINSMCPGWVKTEMGGRNATREPIKATETILWLDELDENGPSGGFFRDGKALAW